MKKNVYVKQLSRDYSLLRIGALEESVNSYLPKLFKIEPVHGVYIFRREHHIVDVYYPKGMVDQAASNAAWFLTDEGQIEKQIVLFNQVFEKLKPFFEDKKNVENIVDLKELYEDYVAYWSLVTVIYYAPEIPGSSEKIKDLCNEARSKSQEYADEIEEVFRSSLAIIVPELSKYERFILPEEVWGKDFEGKDILTMIKNREEGFVCYKGQVHAGRDVTKILMDLDLVVLDSEVESMEVRGQIAKSGKVSGVVKVVMHHSQIEKVEDGDILVAPMTMPRFMPAMRRAAAFVTDEGGLLCHAAIVAREMGKPCIIATNVATSVLKDGDLVEVDGEKGVVRKL